MAILEGTTVYVHYRGTLADGSEFDSSEGRDPLSFIIGAGQVIPGFEQAVANLDPGDSVTITLPPTDAYGERLTEAVEHVPLDAFGGETPEVGAVVRLIAPDGSHHAATVSDLDGDIVELDFNHPLAGEELTFRITLVNVVEPD